LGLKTRFLQEIWFFLSVKFAYNKPVTIFSFLAGAGATLGLWQVARRAQSQHTRRLLDYGTLVLLAALLGARVFYVVVHGAYYAAHPLEAVEIWLGGLSWPGAAMGAILELIILSLARRYPLGWLADGLSPLIGPVAIALFLGCWQAGVMYGQALPNGSLGFPTVDEAGAVSVRVPLQLICALGLLVYLWIAEHALAPLDGKRSYPGLRASLFSLGLGLALLAAESLRADPVPYWGSLSVDTWCAYGLIALSLLGVFASLVRIKR